MFSHINTLMENFFIYLKGGVCPGFSKFHRFSKIPPSRRPTSKFRYPDDHRAVHSLRERERQPRGKSQFQQPGRDHDGGGKKQPDFPADGAVPEPVIGSGSFADQGWGLSFQKRPPLGVAVEHPPYRRFLILRCLWRHDYGNAVTRPGKITVSEVADDWQPSTPQQFFISCRGCRGDPRTAYLLEVHCFRGHAIPLADVAVGGNPSAEEAERKSRAGVRS